MELTLTGQRPKTVGSGYLPRGLYIVTCAFAQEKGTDNKPEFLGIDWRANVTQAYVFNAGEDGKGWNFEIDESLAGRDLKKHFAFKDGKNEGGDKARESELGGLLIGFGLITLEAWNAAAASKTPINIPKENIPGLFQGKQAIVVFDPPPVGAGNGNFPELRFVDQARANKILKGERFGWPWDGKKPKADARAALGGAAGTTVGGMLGSVAGQGMALPAPAAAPPGIVPPTAPTGGPPGLGGTPFGAAPATAVASPVVAPVPAQPAPTMNPGAGISLGGAPAAGAAPAAGFAGGIQLG